MSAVRWLVDFYNERRGIVARYAIEAALPVAAVRLARDALVAEYPPPARARQRLSLFDTAERTGGQDGTGWIVYRIVKDDDRHAAPSVRVGSDS